MVRYDGTHHHTPSRYAYNNGKFKRQLTFGASTGGTRLLGFFLIPPSHELKSLKMSLSTLGVTTVNDDLEGEIGSFITAMDVGEKSDFYGDADTIDKLENWAQENLPNTITAKSQDSSNYWTDMWDNMDVWYGADDNDAYGAGHINKEGHGRALDAPYKLLFKRHVKTHPIYGKGMMVGTSSLDAGGKYTPVDMVSTTIKRNVVARNNPVLVSCFITAPLSESNTGYEDVMVDMSNAEKYVQWIDLHSPYKWAEHFASEGLDPDDHEDSGATFDAGVKLLAPYFVETNVDEGRPTQWNCTWKFSAQIAPPVPNQSIPNVTVTSLRRF
tara:strand:+ start:989 stop:1969 length:981 start_codon:yes stop_codon:yes gene_type:complete